MNFNDGWKNQKLFFVTFNNIITMGINNKKKPGTWETIINLSCYRPFYNMGVVGSDDSNGC